jgi:hypothetical protein
MYSAMILSVVSERFKLMRSVKRDIFATRKGKAESSKFKAFYFLTQMNLRCGEREFAPFKMDRR